MTTTITTPSANRIGAAFISTYYNALVSDNLPMIVQMYGETSTVGFVEIEDAKTHYYRGRSEIKAYHEAHRNVMGPCKVSIRNIDIVPADHYIALTCSGHYLTETQSRVFTQTFVLSPTKYRENTYYIAGETMRFLSVMTDVAEDGVRLVSEEEYHRIMNAPLEMEEASDESEAEAEAIIDAAAAAIASALSPSEAVVQIQNEEQQHQQRRPARERKPREPRERKPRERKNNTSNGTEETNNSHQEPQQRKQRERRHDANNATAASSQNESNNERNKSSRRNDRDSHRRPADENTKDSAKPNRSERKPREGTDTRSLATSIIFGPVDAVFKLSELSKACQEFGTLQDSYWVNEDAVMEFSDAAAVTNAIRKGVSVRDSTWRPRPYRPKK